MLMYICSIIDPDHVFDYSLKHLLKQLVGVIVPNVKLRFSFTKTNKYA